MLRSCTLLSLAAAVAAGDPTTIDPATAAVSVGEPLLISASASGTPTARRRLDRIAGGAGVIDADSLHLRRAATWSDLLAGAPGVVAQPRLGGDELRLSIRGSGVQRTFHLRGIALIQDDQPLSAADGSADFQASDPQLIERAEILRGPAGLRLGTATLGGAIALVSPTGRTRPGLRAQAEAGSFGAGKLSLSAGLAEGDQDAWIGVSQAQTDGERMHSAQRGTRLAANLGWQLGAAAEHRISAAFSDSGSELPGSLTRSQLESDPTQAASGNLARQAKRDYPLWRIADRWTFDLGTWQVQAGIGWMRKELDHPLSFALITQTSEDLSASLRLVGEPALAGRPARVALGATVLHGVTDAWQHGYALASGQQRGALQADAEQTARDAALWAEVQVEAAVGWWLIAGLHAAQTRRQFADRFLANGDQSDEREWLLANPSLGVRREVPGPGADPVQVYAVLARSSEAPTFAEYVQRDGSGQTRPQPLAAQTAWTLELGSRGRGPSGSWDVSIHASRVRGEYLAYQIAPGLTQTINAGTTHHLGAELGGDAQLAHGWLAAGDRLRLLGSATWMRLRFAGDPVFGDGPLPGLPEWSGRVELRYERGPWTLAAIADGQSDWAIDPADRVSAPGSLRYGLRAAYDPGRHLSAWIEGRNLADRAFVASSGIAAPGADPATAAVYNPGEGLNVHAGMAWSW